MIRSPHMLWRADPLWKRALRHRTRGRRNGTNVRGARSPQAVAAGEDQRPDGRRNRCRVSGAATWRSLRNLPEAGDRRCGRGLSDRAKGFSQDVPSARQLVFSTALASCGCGAASYSARRSRTAALAAVRTVQPHGRRSSSHHPRHQRGHSHGASCRFVPQAQPLSLASTAFCAISRPRLPAPDCNRRPIAGCIGGLLWNTETRLGRCHRRV